MIQYSHYCVYLSVNYKQWPQLDSIAICIPAFTDVSWNLHDRCTLVLSLYADSHSYEKTTRFTGISFNTSALQKLRVIMIAKLFLCLAFNISKNMAYEHAEMEQT